MAAPNRLPDEIGLHSGAPPIYPSAENSINVNFSDLHDPAAAAELIKQFKRRYSAKVCLAPDKNCEGSIVSAHTLSASLMLRPLARDGKVYALKAQLPPPPGQNPMELALRGIRETSVFNGFCSKHDKSLFSPIEDSEFICSKEQLFVLAYRCVAKEAYLKRKQAESLPSPEEIKRIHGLADKLQFSDLALVYQAASLRGAEEVERLKSRLDLYLLSGDYGRIETTVLQFASPPPVAASFVYAPDFDFEGKYLQNFEGLSSDLSHLMVTLFPANGGGFLLLSHEDTANDAPRRIIASLRAQADVPSSAVWLVACQTENFAISPDWFESLSEEHRDAFKAGFYSNASPTHQSFNNLQTNPLVINDWKLQHVFTI